MRKKYLINSFYFQKQLFEKHLSDRFDFDFIPPYHDVPMGAARYIPLNLWHTERLYMTGAARKYDVVHFNRPEAMWAFRPLPKQASVFEAHGFDVGMRAEPYLKDIGSVAKKALGWALDRFMRAGVRRNIARADIFYCSTPDLIEPLAEWCGREPVWLPNPIDGNFWTPAGDKVPLAGSPACFLAARLHGDKRPDIAIDIFRNHVKPRFKDATLHMIGTGELASRYRKELSDPKTYFWHGYMGKPALAATLRGADLVFGDFSIGALSLLPLQAMALGRPIVTLDRYEIVRREPDELPALALRLLSDPDFRDESVRANREHALSVHGGSAVCARHLAMLRPFLHSD